MAYNNGRGNRNFYLPKQLRGFQEQAIEAERAPTVNDMANIGRDWLDLSTDESYKCFGTSSGDTVWKNTSSIPSTGTDGQLWIAATAAAPAWANVTSTGLTVTVTNTPTPPTTTTITEATPSAELPEAGFALPTFGAIIGGILLIIVSLVFIL